MRARLPGVNNATSRAFRCRDSHDRSVSAYLASTAGMLRLGEGRIADDPSSYHLLRLRWFTISSVFTIYEKIYIHIFQKVIIQKYTRRDRHLHFSKDRERYDLWPCGWPLIPFFWLNARDQYELSDAQRSRFMMRMNRWSPRPKPSYPYEK